MKLEDRFWKKVNKLKPVDCWEWTAQTVNGYGRIRVNGKNRMATHIALHLQGIEVPHGKIVCHKCDNRICVNHDHLYVGTYQDNYRDFVERGNRHLGREFEYAKGVGLPQSKLNDEKIREIRQRFAAGEVKRVLSEEFCVTVTQVQNIVHRRSWKHVK